MSEIAVTVPETGQQLIVNVPRRIDFDPPADDLDTARRALTRKLVPLIEPRLHRLVAVKQVIRDSDNHIVGTREIEIDTSRAALALAVARRVAEQVLPEGMDED